MTCDEARVQTLRGLADVPSLEAREHLTACSPCADYASDAEALWDVAATAAERCPERRRRWRSTAAAAALIVAATAWAAWPRDEAAKPAAQDVVAREKQLLADFETRLSATEKGLGELAGLPVREKADRSRALLSGFPSLKLTAVAAPETDYRAKALKLRLQIAGAGAELRLLGDTERPDRDEVTVRLMHELRAFRGALADLEARGPNGGVLGGAVQDPRTAILDKLRSIKVTIDVKNASMENVVRYFKEISGLEMAIHGPKEARDVMINLDLRDVTLEAALEPMTTVAGFTWEVDRLGVLVFTPAKR
jgi:hypothetical protein